MQTAIFTERPTVPSVFVGARHQICFALVTLLDVYFNVTSSLARNKFHISNPSSIHSSSHPKETVLTITFARYRLHLDNPSIHIATMAFPRFIIALFTVLATLVFARPVSGMLLPSQIVHAEAECIGTRMHEHVLQESSSYDWMRPICEPRQVPL